MPENITWNNDEQVQITPYTASSFAPEYFIIVVLIKSINAACVSSISPDEAPEVRMTAETAQKLMGRLNFSPHLFEKKWLHSTPSWIAVPMTVAIAAPRAPMFRGNTKNQSPNILNTPPMITAFMTRFGALSFRMKTPKKMEIVNIGKNAAIHFA
jgi:hypothetical protein